MTFGTVHGYFETYGAASSDVTVELRDRHRRHSPALLNADVRRRTRGRIAAIFSRVMPVHQLPPGKYLLRAIVSVNNRSVKTLTRGFEIAPSEGADDRRRRPGARRPATLELFLPVDEQG